MKPPVRWFSAGLALFFLLVVSAAPLRADTEGHFDRTLAITGPVQLEVETGAGSISVRAGTASKVEVHATIRANHNWDFSERNAEENVRYVESHPPIEQSGNHITIGRMEDRERFRNISISYELVVPAETEMRSASGSGSQTIEAIEGPVETSSGSGSLRISQIAKEVRARTGSGGIELNEIHSGARASTGSGGIRAIGIAGGLTASTGSGSIKLEQTSAGDVDAETGSGSIELSGVKGSINASTGSGSIRAQGEPVNHWRLHTGSGSVTVHLPEQAGFELNARTNSGSVETAHPLEIVVQGTISKRELRGKVRGGGPLVDLNTGSGNIHIE
jgi:DUF4097 and DUF4098 domain-containing protein YvlB